jgi:hypothetical protein
VSDDKIDLQLLGTRVAGLIDEVRDLKLRFSAIETRLGVFEVRFSAMEARFAVQEERMSAMLAILVRLAERPQTGSMT